MDKYLWGQDGTVSINILCTRVFISDNFLIYLLRHKNGRFLFFFRNPSIMPTIKFRTSVIFILTIWAIAILISARLDNSLLSIYTGIDDLPRYRRFIFNGPIRTFWLLLASLAAKRFPLLFLLSAVFPRPFPLLMNITFLDDFAFVLTARFLMLQLVYRRVYGWLIF